jgi:hypothetical protein
VPIEEGWNADADVSYDSLYVFIRALRLKITRTGEPEKLHTVRGGQRIGSGHRQVDRGDASRRSSVDSEERQETVLRMVSPQFPG